MPCKDAVITGEILKVSPDNTVAEAMELFETKRIRGMPVVDANNKLVGLFTLRCLLNSLLPVAATMEQGLESLDFVVGTSPGVAKRLRKIQDKKVSEIMVSKFQTVHPDTSTWEAVRIMAVYGSPVPVVDEGTGDFIGLVSGQSMLKHLNNKLEELDKDEDAV